MHQMQNYQTLVLLLIFQGYLSMYLENKIFHIPEKRSKRGRRALSFPLPKYIFKKYTEITTRKLSI